MPDLIVVLAGIHQTLSAEQDLAKAGVRVSLVPTPPAIRTGCGFSLSVSVPEDVPPWWKDFTLPAVLYRVVLQEGVRRYEEIDRRHGAGVSAAGDPVQKGLAGKRPR